jgi:hypothetical protein
VQAPKTKAGNHVIGVPRFAKPRDALVVLVESPYKPRILDLERQLIV